MENHGQQNIDNTEMPPPHPPGYVELPSSLAAAVPPPPPSASTAGINVHIMECIKELIETENDSLLTDFNYENFKQICEKCKNVEITHINSSRDAYYSFIRYVVKIYSVKTPTTFASPIGTKLFYQILKIYIKHETRDSKLNANFLLKILVETIKKNMVEQSIKLYELFLDFFESDLSMVIIYSNDLLTDVIETMIKYNINDYANVIINGIKHIYFFSNELMNALASGDKVNSASRILMELLKQNKLINDKEYINATLNAFGNLPPSNEIIQILGYLITEIIFKNPKHYELITFDWIDRIGYVLSHLTPQSQLNRSRHILETIKEKMEDIMNIEPMVREVETVYLDTNAKGFEFDAVDESDAKYVYEYLYRKRNKCFVFVDNQGVEKYHLLNYAKFFRPSTYSSSSKIINISNTTTYYKCKTPDTMNNIDKTTDYVSTRAFLYPGNGVDGLVYRNDLEYALKSKFKMFKLIQVSTINAVASFNVLNLDAYGNELADYEIDPESYVSGKHCNAEEPPYAVYEIIPVEYTTSQMKAVNTEHTRRIRTKSFGGQKKTKQNKKKIGSRKNKTKKNKKM